MLASILAEYGMHLKEQNKITLGWHHNIYIRHDYTISMAGELIKYYCYKDEEQPKYMHPVAFFGDCFSDYVNQGRTCQHLLSIRMCDLSNAEGQPYHTYVEELRELSKDNQYINAVYLFVTQSVPTICNLHTQKDKDIVGFSFWENGRKINLLEIPEVKKCTALYLISKMNNKGTKERCDITGVGASHYISGHSRVFNFEYPTRIVTRMMYDDYYGGKKNPNAIISKISAETELLIAGAVYYITQNQKNSNTHIRCLGDMQTCEIMNIWGSIYTFVGRDNLSRADWEEFSLFFKNKHANSVLFMVDVGYVNKGRVSTFRADRYTPKQSQKMIDNILRWYSSIVIWDKDEISFALPPIYKMVEELSPLDKDSTLLKYAGALVAGDVSWLVDRFLVPHMFCAAKSADHMNIYAEVISNLMKTFQDTICYESLDFKAGRLLAIAHLMEQRYYYLTYQTRFMDMSLAQKKMKRYRRAPYSVWIVLRGKMAVFIQRQDRFSRWLYEQMCVLQTELRMDYDFEHARNLNPEMYVGYDTQMTEYWEMVNKYMSNEEETNDDD